MAPRVVAAQRVTASRQAKEIVQGVRDAEGLQTLPELPSSFGARWQPFRASTREEVAVKVVGHYGGAVLQVRDV
ncbi:hypothetical protein [Streptosporangium sp. NPDC049078]|uniref:hypothetical protein n=1 Tax=Streptosporangium sp. NPDC049078 TaxID=3155767 RepID=UPI00341E13F4